MEWRQRNYLFEETEKNNKTVTDEYRMNHLICLILLQRCHMTTDTGECHIPDERLYEK